MVSFIRTSQTNFWVLLCVAVISLQNADCQSTNMNWITEFTPNNITIHMHTVENVNLRISGVDLEYLVATGSYFRVVANNPKLLIINTTIRATDFNAGQWSGNVTLDAVFLGLTNAYVELVSSDGHTTLERSASTLPVVIIREVRTIDHIFTGSVATLVSLLYINFGAALNLKNIRGIVVRPIGPAIGLFGQFLIMPLVRISS